MKRYSFFTKIGYISLFSEDNKIIKISMNSNQIYNDEPDEVIALAKKEIDEYLKNKRRDFTFSIEVKGTNFQLDVLETMIRIPYGETWSYSKLAKESGHETAVRAVGTVCKNNQLPIVIPCHRVIKANGDIGNYNGGVMIKEMLIEQEKKPSI
jgi:O-6-methylguanine DNA methyltransferase